MSWNASEGAASYQYCFNSDQLTCNWIDAAGTTAALGGLTRGATYYWQVRAVNPSGQTLADGGGWWSFTVTTVVTLVDSSATNFRAGQVGTCRVDAYNGDGAVQLPMTVEEGFTGPDVPTGWTPASATASSPGRSCGRGGRPARLRDGYAL